MKKLVIVTHPNIEASTINKKWIENLQKNPEKYTIHSLYGEYPSLDFDIAKEQALIEQYDEIIFQFPLHWFSTPYALKKYIDDVFTYGWAFGEGGDKIQGKKIGLAVSTGGDEEVYKAPNGIPVKELLNDVILVFKFCGAEFTDLHTLYGAHNPDENALEANTKVYAATF
ncbi:NAD(P)H-dependent oxidoreductase [uncultured Tenacibaculum sp.]|uniref:NAD(P)H-dependent oxidoreductase n=1 Tax=uncultured Tenacibaculum sp. TaxID=174713 RepID=UPI002621C0E7|nr:NAD(P)H-dependent oxidoreductase [uncultured Tenacibaculum sp.]